MPTIEDLEHRVARLESLYDEVIKEKLGFISQRLDQIYEKTERDKVEILAKIERDKTEIITRLIKWMIGLLVGFLAVLVTIIWAMPSFALKQQF